MYRLTFDRQQALDDRVAGLEKRVCAAEAFSKKQSVLEDSMGSLKGNASQTDAHLREIEARILKLEPLLERRVCDAEAFSKRQSVLEDSMGSLKNNASQTDAHLREIEARILKLEPLLERRVCDAEAFSKRQSALEDSMGNLKNNASQTDAHLREIEARILKLEPLLADQRKLTKQMDRMEREISDLDQRIPDFASADDFQLNFAPKMNEQLHQVLEGQPSSKASLQKNSASEASQNTYKPETPPSLMATASWTKASTREVFVPFKPFKNPPHPEDETARRCTLQVEEELHKAMGSNAPLGTRKKLLKEVQLRRLRQVILLQCE